MKHQEIYVSAPYGKTPVAFTKEVDAQRYAEGGSTNGLSLGPVKKLHLCNSLQELEMLPLLEIQKAALSKLSTLEKRALGLEKP